MRHILKALKCCHDKYMGHYDIKLENFMYHTKALTNLKMIDLGLSNGFSRGCKGIRGTLGYVAPEVIDGICGPEADVWSAGVMLFAMLTGEEFTDLPDQATRDQMLTMMRSRFNDRRWTKQRLDHAAQLGLSPEALDLLSSMLMHDRHLRPSVAEALDHPFVKDSYSFPLGKSAGLYNDELNNQANLILKELIQSFCAFAVEPMLKRAALLLLAHLAGRSGDEMRPQRLAFRMLDKDGAGELSVDAIEMGLRIHGIQVFEDLDDLFAHIDFDNTGYISFVAFLSATLPPSVRLDETLHKRIFALSDRNNDGFIDACDLADAFGYNK